VKRGGFFQRRLFLSVFVRTITSERLNAGWRNLAVRCTVQKSRASSKAKVKCQGYQGQKWKKNCWVIPTDNVYYSVRRRPYAVADDAIAWPPRGDRLRRWENQRMLSSLTCIYHTVVYVYMTRQRATRRQNRYERGLNLFRSIDRAQSLETAGWITFCHFISQTWNFFTAFSLQLCTGKYNSFSLISVTILALLTIRWWRYAKLMTQQT